MFCFYLIEAGKWWKCYMLILLSNSIRNFRSKVIWLKQGQVWVPI